MTAVWVWALGALSYMILAGQFSGDEVVAAGLLGVVAVLWHRALMGAGAGRFAFDRQALAVLARAVGGLPSATVAVGGRLAAALIGPVAGTRVAREFSNGRRDAPGEAGRRAVVVLAASLAPDAYVLRLPRDEDTILYHAITGREPSGDPRWPS